MRFHEEVDSGNTTLDESSRRRWFKQNLEHIWKGSRTAGWLINHKTHKCREQAIFGGL